MYKKKQMKQNVVIWYFFNIYLKCLNNAYDSYFRNHKLSQN